MTERKSDPIQVRVQRRYVQERSNPSRSTYFFAYHITIINLGTGPAQLLNRYWQITDGNGNIEEVRGPNVVGQQPRLLGEETFEYTSFCPPQTELGVMQGHFEMVYDNGGKFIVPIALFQLTVPYSVN